MAFLIHKNNSLFNIVENENQKNDLNYDLSSYISLTISQEDFNNIKKNLASPILTDGTLSLISRTAPFYDEEQQLKSYIDNVKNEIKSFIKVESNNNKILYNTAINYFNTLETFNTSTITFPMDISWEQHCENNSIDYLHPLQIP